MRNVVWALLIFVTSATAHARWEVERLPTQATELEGTRFLPEQPSRVLGYSLLKRTIPTRFGEIGVATIANSVLKKDKATDVDISAMAEGVRDSLKSPTWKREDHDGVAHFTAAWPQQHRLLQLKIRSVRDRWLISFATIRDPFIKIGAEEADLLQRAFFVIEAEGAKKAQFGKNKRETALIHLLLPAAEAYTTSEVMDLTRGFQNSIRSITDNVGINGARELTGSINALGGDVGQLGLDTRAAAADMRAGTHELSETVKKTISFKNGFLFGVGIGVGTALGTVATNFFLDGSAKLARDAWFALIGRMKPEDQARLDARANKAMEQLASSSAKLEEIENDLTVLGMAATEAIGRPGVAIAELSEAQIFEYRDQMDKLKKKLSEATSTDERRVCANELSELDAVLRYKEAMKPIFRQSPTIPQVCEKIERLLEDWKLSEATLQQSKMIVASESSTLLDGLRKRALDALPEDISRRKRVNECESRVKDLVSKHEDLYKLSNCAEAKGADLEACALYERKITSLNSSIKKCESDVDASFAAVSPQSLTLSIEGSENETAIFRKRFEGILKADCREGETASPCDGKVGDLETLRARYRSRVDAARKICPNMNLVAQDSNRGAQGSASTTDGAQTESTGNRAPASLIDSGQTPESTGFFGRLWASIRRFFTGK
jgi:hypothetical protein